ncbi:hypothetical protein ACTXG5_04705 [Mycobacterium sp. Dal123C01]|uniref:hypothetical protein n=1 Tax=Mycobacterium sp. Dal123C01 TaxID=3457577 RepID=UPI00403E44FC
MKSPQPLTAATIVVALLGLVGSAVNGLGFFATDLELAKLVGDLGILAPLLLVTEIVPAPLVFGKTMAGFPTQPLAWTVFVCTLITQLATLALAVSRPTRQPGPARAG